MSRSPTRGSANQERVWLRSGGVHSRSPARHIAAMAKRAVDFAKLRELPIAERLRLVEDLWDTIAAEAPDEALPVSPELQAELDRRLGDHRSDPTAAGPWEEIRSGILRERGRGR